jgi:acyl-CoA dehydrogenase
MDVHGGKGICEGPGNYLANIYHAMPVSITVEGANILTRSLIVFGQGAVRCHPYLLKEMEAARDPDPAAGLAAFDAAIWKHAGHIAATKLRCLWTNMTGAAFVSAPRAGRATPLYRELAQASANFAFTAEIAMVLLGGNLKRRESLSARLGDALANLYLLSCCLKRFEDEGRPSDDWPLLQWCAAATLHAVDEAIDGVLLNLPARFVAWALRLVVRPWWGRARPPRDALNALCSDILLTPSPARDRLTAGIYLGKADEPVATLEAAMHAVIGADVIAARMRDAGVRDVDEAQRRNLITAADAAQLATAAKLKRDVIMVDDFAPETLSPIWNQPRG